MKGGACQGVCAWDDRYSGQPSRAGESERGLATGVVTDVREVRAGVRFPLTSDRCSEQMQRDGAFA